MSQYTRTTTKDTKPQGKASVIRQADLERMFGDGGFRSVRDQVLFGLCRYTAARINEVCQMKISDVFLPSGKVKAEIVFRTETTKGDYGQKTVKVSPDLKALLEAYEVPQKGIYLFPGRHGRGHINPVSASHIFKEVCDRLELHHVSTHSFRRTAINRMREAGFLLEEIQRISGHKSLDGLSHYLEVSESRLSEAVLCSGSRSSTQT